jgi:hypothetical protein
LNLELGNHFSSIAQFGQLAGEQQAKLLETHTEEVLKLKTKTQQSIAYLFSVAEQEIAIRDEIIHQKDVQIASLSHALSRNTTSTLLTGVGFTGLGITSGVVFGTLLAPTILGIYSFTAVGWLAGGLVSVCVHLNSKQKQQ